MKLLVSYIILIRKFFHASQWDALIVGHPGYFHIHLARLLIFLSRKKRLLVYDAFIPLHDALVMDRRLFRPRGVLPRLLHAFEAFCCQVADVCLVDTLAHARYLANEYGLEPYRVKRIFVGPTIERMFESPEARGGGDRFRVLFFGTYIPLHGIDVILKAAHLLRNERGIRFLLIGKGQMRAEMDMLARRLGPLNVTFRDWVSTRMLGDLIRSHDLALGIFGTLAKTERVIPSKVYDICAVGTPFITANTPAMREVFRHQENAYLVPPGDPEALANAIMCLKEDSALRARIAEGAFETGKSLFSIEQIGQELAEVIRKAWIKETGLISP